MVEREKAFDKLQLLLRELARNNVKLQELAVANLSYLKPRVRKFLNEGIDFPLNEVLTETEEKIVRYYLGLSGTGKMRGLEETARHLGRSEKSANLIGATFRFCMIKLKRRELVGPEAVEILRLPGLIYNRLIGEGVVEIGDIPKLSNAKIKAVCGTEWGISQLREAMENRGVEWNHKIKFPLFAAKTKGY